VARNEATAEYLLAQVALTRCSRQKIQHALGASVTFERPLSPSLKYFSHCAAIALCRARKTYFWIFPVAVLGSSLMKVTLCGALWACLTIAVSA